MPPIETSPFRLHPSEMRRIVTLLYFRKLWGLLVPQALFGLAILIWAPKEIAWIGLFALAWPFLLPLRIWLVGARRFNRLPEMRLRWDAGRLQVFIQGKDQPETPSALKGLTRLGPYRLISIDSQRFFAVPDRAFQTPEEGERFQRELQEAIKSGCVAATDAPPPPSS